MTCTWSWLRAELLACVTLVLLAVKKQVGPGRDDSVSVPGSTDGVDLLSDDAWSSSEHIACFTVPTRGRRLQPQPWISHATVDNITTASDQPPQPHQPPTHRERY